MLEEGHREMVTEVVALAMEAGASADEIRAEFEYAIKITEEER